MIIIIYNISSVLPRISIHSNNIDELFKEV